MVIKKNPAGYVYSDIEADLYSMLEKGYIKIPNLIKPESFPHFFGVKRQPDFRFTDQRDGSKIFVEIKPRFVTIDDMCQLLRYYIHIEEEGHSSARLGVLCAGIDKKRRKILESLGIEIFLLKDTIISKDIKIIKEKKSSNNDLIDWM